MRTLIEQRSEVDHLSTPHSYTCRTGHDVFGGLQRSTCQQTLNLKIWGLVHNAKRCKIEVATLSCEVRTNSLFAFGAPPQLSSYSTIHGDEPLPGWAFCYVVRVARYSGINLGDHQLKRQGRYRRDGVG